MRELVISRILEFAPQFHRAVLDEKSDDDLLDLLAEEIRYYWRNED